MAVSLALVATGCSNQQPAPEPTPSADVAEPSPTPTPTPTLTPTPTPTPAAFDRTAESIDDPASYWVVSNKLRPLKPKEFVPKDLRAVNVPHVYAPMLRDDAATAVEKLFRDFAKETGLTMKSQSAYRSYSTQVSTYNGWVSRLGKEAADLTSARPGHSEHQTGLAIDISASDGTCSLDQCFADTEQGKWLAKNAWRYGFHLRYPEGKTAVTGFEFEPWHYRFVGKALARELHDTRVATLEEFFGLKAAPDYAG